MSKKSEKTKKMPAEREQYIKDKDEFIMNHKKSFSGHAPFLNETGEERQFISVVFNKLACNTPLPQEPEPPAKELREWPYLSRYIGIEQDKNWEEMKAFCTLVDSDHDPDTELKYVIIDFGAGEYVWDDQLVYLDNACVEIEIYSPAPAKRRMDCFTLHSEDRINAIVYMCKIDGVVQAVLQAVDNEGKIHFFELSYFSMLFLMRNTVNHFMLCRKYPDTADVKAGSPETSVAAESESHSSEHPGPTDDTGVNESGMFTLFSKGDRMLYVVNY